MLRGRRSVAVDLKHADGLATARRLVDQADVLIEGYRPGVAERLGLGPDVCLERNPALVYARITGWGQDGPYAETPGHDINYLALAGALDLLRRADEPPAPPLNLLGDYGGGGMLLVVGILGALFERSRSGHGQVVDAAMVDGVALLTTIFHGMMAEGLWPEVPGSHVLAARRRRSTTCTRPPTASTSPSARASRSSTRGSSSCWAPTISRRNRATRRTWPDGKERLAAIFKTKTRDEWCELLDGTDTCFAPVLAVSEAREHPQLVARATYVDVDGVVQPASAPRFSRTPAADVGSLAVTGQHTTDVLHDWGFTHDEIDDLLAHGAAVQARIKTSGHDEVRERERDRRHPARR